MVGYFVYVVALRDKFATCPPSCREQVLVGKDLRDGSWHGVDFQYANLSQANLAGTDLGGADFYFANLIRRQSHRRAAVAGEPGRGCAR